MRSAQAAFGPLRRSPAASGFTLLELAVSLVIIGILAAVLLNRLAYYSEAAEKAAMEATLRLIKTGLQIRLAELIAAHRQGLAGALESEDPTRWLEQKPGNYGGRWGFSASRGTWYFDDSARQLVYVVNSGSRLELDSPDPRKILRFRARLLSDRVQTPGGPVDSVTGITLLAVQPYHWR